MKTIKFNNRYNNLIELQEVEDNIYLLNTNAHYIRENFDGGHLVGIDPEGGPMFSIKDEHPVGTIKDIFVRLGKYFIEFNKQ